MQSGNAYPPLTAYDIERMAMAGGKYSKIGQGFLTCCFVHPDKTPSLSLALGDHGELLAHCFAGCSFEEIMNALKRSGLLSDRQSNSAYSSSSMRTREKPKANQDKSSQFNRYACELWGKAQPVKGTLAEVYLNKRLDGRLTSIPPTLRFLPTLKHTPSGNVYPCLIGAVTRFPDKKIIALHRTYLASDGSGKAPVEKPKMFLGDAKGGAIRLDAATDELILCEGLEDGLSLWLILNKPVWVAGNARFLESIIPPLLPLANKIYIAQDNDKAGRESTESLGNRLYAEGRIVKILTPPQPYKDFNQIIQDNKHIESPTKDSTEPSRKEIR